MTSTPLYAQPKVRQGRRISPFWAFPIIAALVGAWLAWVTLSEKGPTIEITFKTAAGLEAGKTRIKHKDIPLGVVEKVEPSRDLSRVIVTAKMNKRAAEHLTDKTRFWVVRPRLSLSNMSGLDTLVSGAYIEMDPSAGSAAERFVGLEEPPAIAAGTAGREFVLTTDRGGALGPNSPVFYRGIKVGEVMSTDASDLQGDIKVHIFVEAPYDALVFDGTHFWSASGISLGMGPNGFKLEMESLDAVLSGGVAFETSESARRGEPSKALTSFTLFSDRTAARDSLFTRTSRAIVEFGGSVNGLQVGAPVEFRGIKVGKVVDFHLAFDPTTDTFRIPVTIDVEFERIRLTSGDYSQYGGGRLARELVARGMRAQLKSTSLLTGALVVTFDFFPNAPPAEVEMTGQYPKLPSVPNEMENITRSIDQALSKLASLPLDLVIDDLRKVLKSADGLVGGAELKESVTALRKTLTSAERLVNRADGEVGPLLQTLRATADSATGAVRRAEGILRSVETGYGANSEVNRELVDMLRQMRDAARSVKLLADFVEQHPETFIRGKGSR